MQDFLAVTKALADESRLRLLLALEAGELCVCQLIEFAGLAPSTVSKHLSILRAARLIDGRKEGRWMYYRLAEESATAPAKAALAWVCECLHRDPGVRADKKRLKEVLRADPEDLCRKQCCR